MENKRYNGGDFIMKRMKKVGARYIKGLVVAVGMLPCAMAINMTASSTVTSGYLEMPDYLDGSMMPIRLDHDESLREIGGDTLTPIFVNYLGRHGARYLSSEKKIEKLRGFLTEAKKAGQLTPHGEAFMELLKKVESTTDGNWGALDLLGIEEQMALARQMYALFPDLLETGKIEAVATYVPRVVMSMYEFCHELGQLSPNLEIYTSAGRQNSAELRYFSVNPRYEDYLKNGIWKEILRRYEEKNVPEAPAGRLVKKGYATEGRHMRVMTLDMYGVLQSLRATGMGTPDTRWMTEDEYAACWRADNLAHFLSRTANSLSSEPGKAAAPLLMSFISSGDSVNTGHNGDKRGMLRFAHAETLMPLFSLMKIPGCWSDSRDYDRIYEYWRDYDIVPLGANLIVAMLRGESGEVYAAMRLNGEWISPCGDGRKLVRWEELKHVWLSSLAALS